MLSSNKLESSKKDMNFFSEFSSSGGQLNSYMYLILIVFIGMLILGALLYFTIFVQSASVGKDMDDMTNKMNTEEYTNAVSQYNAKNAEISNLNQTYFDITSLYSKVSSMDKIDSKIMDTVYQNLPLDIVITDFTFANGTVLLNGESNTFYSPLDMIARLSSAKIFTYVDISDIQQVDLSGMLLTDAERLVARPFTFSITGSFKMSYPVNISRLTDASPVAPISAMESTVAEVGTVYSLTGVGTYTSSSGSTYTLSRAVINDFPLDPTNLTVLQMGGTYAIRVSALSDIKLYYTLTSTNGGAQ